MGKTTKTARTDIPELDLAVAELSLAKTDWARCEIAERIRILDRIKDQLLTVAERWTKAAAKHKLIPDGSPLEGEEAISGPYSVMSCCNVLLTTLSQMEGKKFLTGLPTRTTATGQLAVKVTPHSVWERLLLSGIKAEVWMEKGVGKDDLAATTASAYDLPKKAREGKVALVLGAGNIASIAPLDCFHKLFLEHQVVILKMNPVNDYLAEFLSVALKPLIDRNALRIVTGGTDIGGYLCNHPDIDEIHITGAGASHDAIVWGTGEEAVRNKNSGTPINTKRITSELGAVCPTIVVPGPWSAADLRYQAEHIATQKLHNSGFNCIACQMLILPKGWSKGAKLLENLQSVIKSSHPRQLYYPGAAQRMAEFERHGSNILTFERDHAPDLLVAPLSRKADDWFQTSEVFAPAMSTFEIAAPDAETYLKQAIDYANTNLHGTLGANILIHPKTIHQIGKQKFETLIGELHYGTIAINSWTGLGFLLAECPWGAFPGHTLDDVQSGIGFVHNSFMFDRPERTIVSQSFRPFPRNLLSGGTSLMPRPPWFITNKRQDKIGMLLTRFQHSPSWLKLPRILINALLG
ncbi:MAG: aldehyde dehydrogenase [Alphaproteobacteria bacterium]|nr:aldehyde dehydrogenase [Alphaproteobacteria bacterium]